MWGWVIEESLLPHQLDMTEIFSCLHNERNRIPGKWKEMHPFIKITTRNANRPSLQWLLSGLFCWTSFLSSFLCQSCINFSVFHPSLPSSFHSTSNLFASVTPCHPVAFICDHSKYSLSPKCWTLVDACRLSRVAIPVHAMPLDCIWFIVYCKGLYGLWCGGDLFQLRFLCSSLLSRVYNAMSNVTISKQFNRFVVGSALIHNLITCTL